MSRSIRSAATLAHNAMAGPSRLTSPMLIRPTVHQRTLFGVQLPKLFGKSKRKLTDAELDKQMEATNLSSKQAAALPVRDIRSEKDAVEGSVNRPTDLSGMTGDSSSSSSDSLFAGLDVPDETEEGVVKKAKQDDSKQTKFKEHWYNSEKQKIAPKKLRLLAKQISRLPIDEAILQMQFSLKGAARWIRPNLILAKEHAVHKKGANPHLLVVSEALVNKEKYGAKQIDIKGRGRFGIKRHPYCRLKFVLREGQMMEEVVQKRFEKDVNKHARSATIFREFTPLRRRVNSGWAW